MTVPDKVQAALNKLPEVFDMVAFSTVLSSIAGLAGKLPEICAFIWLLLRIYEMKTVQDFIDSRKKRKAFLKISRTRPKGEK